MRKNLKKELFLFEGTSISRYLLRFFGFDPAQHYNLQDLGILEVDLRFRGGLGPSPIGLSQSPIGLILKS